MSFLRNYRWLQVIIMVLSLTVSGCHLTLLDGETAFPIVDTSSASTTAPEASTVQLSLEPATTGIDPTAVEIFDKISPAVAFVETATGTGSGILIEHGYLLSNAHVVWPYSHVRVVFPDGSEHLDVPVHSWDLIADLPSLAPSRATLNPCRWLMALIWR